MTVKCAILFLAAAVALVPCRAAQKKDARRAADESALAIERLLNSRSAGSPRAFAQAVEVVAADAKRGQPLQKFLMAIIARDEEMPPAVRLTARERETYLAESRPVIRRLAEGRDNPLAWYLLSVDAGDTNLLKRAADGGNVQALNAWGTSALDQALNTSQSKEAEQRAVRAAVAYFEKAAGLGDANGLYNLGMVYARGLGRKRDDMRAFDCFRAAAEKGHPEAINSIGWFFREGRVFGKDLTTAAQWFEKSASYGNPYGHFNWGLALQRGEGVAKDLEKAVVQFRHAAEGGCIEAMAAYGVALARGEGVKVDEPGAVKWFERAAQTGYPPAMENLAECYARGRGVPEDNRKALEWKFRSRAARGDRAAAEWLEKNMSEKMSDM